MIAFKLKFRLYDDERKNKNAVLRLIKEIKKIKLPLIKIYPLVDADDKNEKVNGIGIIGESESVKSASEYLTDLLESEGIEFEKESSDTTDDALVPDDILKDSRTLKRGWKLQPDFKKKQKDADPEKNKQDEFDLALKSGLAFYNLGLYDDAARRLKRAIKIMPDDPEAHHYLGLVYDHNGDFEKASKEFETALKYDPESGASYFFMGNSYQKMENFEKAVEYYKKAIEFDPEVPIIYNNLGWVFYQMGEFEKALRSFDEAINLEPDMPFPYHGLGCVYQDLGYLDEAREAFKEAIELFPEYTAAHLKLGWVHFYLGDLSQAMNEFSSALEYAEDPHYVTSAHYSLGFVYEEENKLQAAEEQYSRVLETDPDFLDALARYGLITVKLGKYDTGIKSLKRALLQDPGPAPDILKGLAYATMKTGKYKESLKYCKEALDIEPGDPEIYELIGSVYQNREEWENAKDVLEEAVKMNPESYLLHYQLGRTYEKLKMPKEAEQEYKGAIAHNTDYIEAYNNLGWLYLEQGRSDEALVLFEKAQEIRPDDPEVLTNLGRANHNMGKYDEALSFYRRVLFQHQDYYHIHTEIGLVYMKQDRLHDAKKEFQAALRSESPQNKAPAYFYLGMLDQMDGNHEGAIKNFSLCLDKMPSFSDAHFRMARSFLEMGDKKKAREEFTHYMEMTPEGAHATEAEEFLSALQAPHKAGKKTREKTIKKEAGSGIEILPEEKEKKIKSSPKKIRNSTRKPRLEARD